MSAPTSSEPIFAALVIITILTAIALALAAVIGGFAHFLTWFF